MVKVSNGEKGLSFRFEVCDIFRSCKKASVKVLFANVIPKEFYCIMYNVHKAFCLLKRDERKEISLSKRGVNALLRDDVTSRGRVALCYKWGVPARRSVTCYAYVWSLRNVVLKLPIVSHINLYRPQHRVSL